MTAIKKLIFGVLAIIFFISSGLFIQLYWQAYDIPERISIFVMNQTERAAISFADQHPASDWPPWVEISMARIAARNPGATYTAHSMEQPDILEEYSERYEQNRDMIGWIKINDTKIDYPVMQTKGDPEYYLHRSFEGKYLYEGTPFLDASSDVLLPSANLLLYGHNMINKTLFGQLPEYLDEEFYREHPHILFDTIYEKGEYEIISVFRSQIYYDNDASIFRYYLWGMIDNEADFAYYVKNILALSEYNTGKTAAWGDQLITLSTCYYHVYDGRLVVVARKI